jgi:hypothetical protein
MLSEFKNISVYSSCKNYDTKTFTVKKNWNLKINLWFLFVVSRSKVTSYSVVVQTYSELNFTIVYFWNIISVKTSKLFIYLDQLLWSCSKFDWLLWLQYTDTLEKVTLLRCRLNSKVTINAPEIFWNTFSRKKRRLYWTKWEETRVMSTLTAWTASSSCLQEILQQYSGKCDISKRSNVTSNSTLPVLSVSTQCNIT